MSDLESNCSSMRKPGLALPRARLARQWRRHSQTAKMLSENACPPSRSLLRAIPGTTTRTRNRHIRRERGASSLSNQTSRQLQPKASGPRCPARPSSADARTPNNNSGVVPLTKLVKGYRAHRLFARAHKDLGCSP